MGVKSNIEWTDSTWNPIRGCTRVSEGCRNCYAEAVAARFSDYGQPYHGLARRTESGPRWTGDVRLVMEHLEDPLHWRKPRRIFVNSMSDLFHEGIPDQWIAEIFKVMENCPHHVFQVLTKRPDRMMQWVNDWCRATNPETPDRTEIIPVHGHIWLGVSVEDQKSADERIPFLLKTAATVRWVSAEPMLEPIRFVCVDEWKTGRRVNWVVCGGESGPNAREFEIEWARELMRACRLHRVPFFMKQVGSNAVEYFNSKFKITDRKGGDMAEWPKDLQVREYPQ